MEDCHGLHGEFQSTLPHGERLFLQPAVHRILSISIHAPARGATSQDPDALAIVMISIHAPARGATCHVGFPRLTQEFQSTLPHGERPPGTSTNQQCPERFQSTLPHGERLCFILFYRRFFVFQSTLPHGERQSFPSLHKAVLQFQSTLPHGERQRQHTLIRNVQYFNPRSRTGSDVQNLFAPILLQISIHAPARGATVTL